MIPLAMIALISIRVQLFNSSKFSLVQSTRVHNDHNQKIYMMILWMKGMLVMRQLVLAK